MFLLLFNMIDMDNLFKMNNNNNKHEQPLHNDFRLVLSIWVGFRHWDCWRKATLQLLGKTSLHLLSNNYVLSSHIILEHVLNL